MCACTAPKVIVLPSDMAVSFAPRGSTIVATNDVYLVPPARMQWFMRQLSLKEQNLR